MATPINRTKITTFPQSSNEYDQWIASGREFVSGQWYEPAAAAPAKEPTLETIGAGVSAAAEKAKALTEQVAREGITPTPTPEPEITPIVEPESTEKFWTGTKFLTDPAEIEAWKKANPGGFDPLATSKTETTPTPTSTVSKDATTDKITADMTAKLEGFQKTMNESFQKYFDEQEKYLQELRDQPTAIEQLQKFREDQKLPMLEKELMGIDQTILDVEGLLYNIEEDIRTRTEGLPVSEAAARRLTAIEQAPLSKRLTDLIRGRQRVAVGLEAKQRVVEEFMTAQETDIQRQRAITEAKLGLGKERLEFEADRFEFGITEARKRAEQGVDAAQIEFDRAIDIDKRRIAEENLKIAQAKLKIAQEDTAEGKITPEEVSPEIDTLANMYLRGESLGSIGATKKAQVVARAEEIKKSPEFKEQIKTELKGDIQVAIDRADYGSREDLINRLVPLYSELTLDEVAAEVYGAIPDVIAEESFWQKLFNR